MFNRSQEPITEEETKRLQRISRRPSINRLWGEVDAQQVSGQKFVDAYQVSVLKSFIPPDFNEELPLYILDIGGMVLVLFGQWMFDPHTLIAPKDVFEAWNCDEVFFSNFSLRCLSGPGIVFQLVPTGMTFVKAERLPSAFHFKKLRDCQLAIGNSSTLANDLEKEGLIVQAKTFTG